jgi:hypothetical protein
MQGKESFMNRVQDRINSFRQQRVEQKNQEQQEILLRKQTIDAQQQLGEEEEKQRKEAYRAELINMGVIDVFKNIIETKGLDYYDQAGILSTPIYGFFGRKIIGQERKYKTSLDDSDISFSKYGHEVELRVATGYYYEDASTSADRLVVNDDACFSPRNSVIRVSLCNPGYLIEFTDRDFIDIDVGAATSVKENPGPNLLAKMGGLLGEKQVETQEEVLTALGDLIAAYKHNADLLINHSDGSFEEADFMKFGEVSSYRGL